MEATAPATSTARKAWPLGNELSNAATWKAPSWRAGRTSTCLQTSSTADPAAHAARRPTPTARVAAARIASDTSAAAGNVTTFVTIASGEPKR